MKYLLDTHIIIWWLDQKGKTFLKEEAKRIIESVDNSIFISYVSILEISIKVSIGKLEIDKNYIDFLKDDAIEILPITIAEIQMLTDLELHHRDPFDRLLICQAIQNGMTLISRDKEFKKYDVKIIEG